MGLINTEDLIQQAYKNKTPLKMRNGGKCYVVHISKRISNFPVCVEQHSGGDDPWRHHFATLAGRSFAEGEDPTDIIGEWVEPRREFAVDEKVFVSLDKIAWYARHFSHYDPQGHARCFDMGATSWSSADAANKTAQWNYIKGAEE